MQEGAAAPCWTLLFALRLAARYAALPAMPLCRYAGYAPYPTPE